MAQAEEALARRAGQRLGCAAIAPIDAQAVPVQGPGVRARGQQGDLPAGAGDGLDLGQDRGGIGHRRQGPGGIGPAAGVGNGDPHRIEVGAGAGGVVVQIAVGEAEAGAVPGEVQHLGGAAVAPVHRQGQTADDGGVEDVAAEGGDTALDDGGDRQVGEHRGQIREGEVAPVVGVAAQGERVDGAARCREGAPRRGDQGHRHRSRGEAIEAIGPVGTGEGVLLTGIEGAVCVAIGEHGDPGQARLGRPAGAVAVDVVEDDPRNAPQHLDIQGAREIVPVLVGGGGPQAVIARGGVGVADAAGGEGDPLAGAVAPVQIPVAQGVGAGVDGGEVQHPGDAGLGRRGGQESQLRRGVDHPRLEGLDGAAAVVVAHREGQVVETVVGVGVGEQEAAGAGAQALDLGGAAVAPVDGDGVGVEDAGVAEQPAEQGDAALAGVVGPGQEDRWGRVGDLQPQVGAGAAAMVVEHRHPHRLEVDGGARGGVVPHAAGGAEVPSTLAHQHHIDRPAVAPVDGHGEAVGGRGVDDLPREGSKPALGDRRQGQIGQCRCQVLDAEVDALGVRPGGDGHIPIAAGRDRRRPPRLEDIGDALRPGVEAGECPGAAEVRERGGLAGVQGTVAVGVVEHGPAGQPGLEVAAHAVAVGVLEEDAAGAAARRGHGHIHARGGGEGAVVVGGAGGDGEAARRRVDVGHIGRVADHGQEVAVAPVDSPAGDGVAGVVAGGEVQGVGVAREHLGRAADAEHRGYVLHRHLEVQDGGQGRGGILIGYPHPEVHACRAVARGPGDAAGGGVDRGAAGGREQAVDQGVVGVGVAGLDVQGQQRPLVDARGAHRLDHRGQIDLGQGDGDGGRGAGGRVGRIAVGVAAIGDREGEAVGADVAVHRVVGEGVGLAAHRGQGAVAGAGGDGIDQVGAGGLEVAADEHDHLGGVLRDGERLVLGQRQVVHRGHGDGDQRLVDAGLAVVYPEGEGIAAVEVRVRGVGQLAGHRVQGREGAVRGRGHQAEGEGVAIGV